MGVAFVAHCLLNQNSKTDGGARCPGVYSPAVEVLRAQGWRIEQMPCPELAFTGLNRFWAVREQYDTPAHRRHCQRLAAGVADAISMRAARGEDIVLIGIEGSPSMGVCITSSDPLRGHDEAAEQASLRAVLDGHGEQASPRAVPDGHGEQASPRAVPDGHGEQASPRAAPEQ